MEGAGFHWADYIVFIAMLAISLGIGLYHAWQGQSSTAEYLMGGRNLKMIPVALSLLVSFISAISILGTPAEMYAYGTQLSMYIFSNIIGGCYGAYIFVPLLYPLKLTSSFEYLEMRFKSSVPRIMAAVIYILMSIFSNAVGVFAPCTALIAVTGFPVWASMTICTVVGTTYTCLGGMKAVIWTDVFQAVIIFVGVIAVVIIGTVKVGGFAEVWKINQAWDRIEFFNFDPDPRTRTTFWNIVVMSGLMFLCISTSQMAVQRYCALPTMQAAKRSILLNVAGFFLMGLLTCTAGIVVFAYYAKLGCDPITSGKLDNPNQIMPYFVMDAMGYPGLPGLFVACLYSGSLSSLSSSLSAMAAITWEDGMKYKFYYLPESTKANITKALVAIYGGLSLAVAFLVSRMGGTFVQIAFSVIGTAYGPIAGMFILGALYPRAGAGGTVLGATIGLSLSMWMAMGSFTLGFQRDLPLKFPTHNCEDQCLRENMTNLFPANFTEPLCNSTKIEQYIPHTLQGVENLYAVSYWWYPTVGIACVLIIGILTSCIPGLRQSEYVKKKYLFPCMRSHAKVCQSSDFADESDEESDSEDAEKEYMMEKLSSL